MNAPSKYVDSKGKAVDSSSIEGEFEVNEGYFVGYAAYEDGSDVPEKELYYIQDKYQGELYEDAYQNYVGAAEAYYDSMQDR